MIQNKNKKSDHVKMGRTNKRKTACTTGGGTDGCRGILVVPDCAGRGGVVGCCCPRDVTSSGA